MVVPPSYTIFDMLNGFQTGRSHMALVSEQVKRCRPIPSDAV